MQKQVKIIGLSINQNFGILQATSLKFDEKNRLTAVKGEVGAGKTTLQRVLKLSTQGSQTLEDKKLYGENVDIVTQLKDGDMNVFVGCKSNAASGGIDYFLYSTDADGKKIKDPVIDGRKATPAAYLKSLQTDLTWNLDELTSENPTTQRNILLKTYSNELAAKGVYFDKSHPKYVGSIIDQIEKAKNDRNYADMKRKEVGGIADDMQKRGIDFDEYRTIKPLTEIEEEIAEVSAEITLAKTNAKQTRDNKILEVKNKGLETVSQLKSENELILSYNRAETAKKTAYDRNLDIYTTAVKKAKEYLLPLVPDVVDKFLFDFDILLDEYTVKPEEPELNPKTPLEFNEKGTCISKPEDFPAETYPEINSLLKNYKLIISDYSKLLAAPEKEVDTTELEAKKAKLILRKESLEEYNREAKAVNSFRDWKAENEKVRDLKKDYFLKLTEIETGVEGLYICPEFIEEEGVKIAKDNDIYLMYDGSYDPEYFGNPTKEIRKLASYSDTQKPMICLLIQKYLLSQKEKALPYLWIDQVPIDNKTKALLDKMAEDLGLWLFVNWTGDFDVNQLKDGEILIQNGEIFEKESENDNAEKLA